MHQPLEYNEDDLVMLLKEGDANAFSYLYDRYSGALNGIILNFVYDQDAALDILQESFIKIWNQISTYTTTKGRLFTWMVAIVRNTAIDTLRSKGWKNAQRNMEITDHDASLQSDTVLNVDTIGLKGFVKALRAEYKQVVELSYFEGLSHSDISNEIGVPIGTVKTRLRNALIELRTFIKN